MNAEAMLRAAHKEDAGPLHYRVLATFNCWRGNHYMPIERVLTVRRDGSDLLEEIARQERDFTTQEWHGYTHSQFVRLIPEWMTI